MLVFMHVYLVPNANLFSVYVKIAMQDDF